MKNKKLWVVIITIVLMFGGCFGDRVISEVLFAHHCKKTGLFIYEPVILDDSFFTDQEKNSLKGLDKYNYNFSKGVYIDKKVFDESFVFEKGKGYQVSSFGPVRVIKSWVVRKNDSKILGENITVVSGMGWVKKFWSFGFSAKGCVNVDGDLKSEYRNSFQKSILPIIFNKN